MLTHEIERMKKYIKLREPKVWSSLYVRICLIDNNLSRLLILPLFVSLVVYTQARAQPIDCNWSPTDVKKISIYAWSVNIRIKITYNTQHEQPYWRIKHGNVMVAKYKVYHYIVICEVHATHIEKKIEIITD